jgi:hypothetical protein
MSLLVLLGTIEAHDSNFGQNKPGPWRFPSSFRMIPRDSTTGLHIMESKRAWIGGSLRQIGQVLLLLEKWTVVIYLQM